MGVHIGAHSRGARVHLDPDYVVGAVYRTGQSASFDLQKWDGEPPAVARASGACAPHLQLPSSSTASCGGDHDRIARECARRWDRPASRRLQRAVRDGYTNAQSREALVALAEEQGATPTWRLVAEGVEAQDIFDAGRRRGTCQLLGATGVTLSHYTPDGFNEMVAGW